MKKNIIKAMAAGVLTLGLASCESSEVTFPDYEGGISVYFAYQTPVRSMMLGIDDLGSTADNDTHTCKIYGTMGGAYNGKNIKVDVAVDESLCKDLYFDVACTKPVVAMPQSYYELKGNVLDYAGDIKGGVEVKLTDAFFADPKSTSVNYVIPVVMTKHAGETYNVLDGELAPGIEAGNRFDVDVWKVAPMDYVLYAVKYVSKYEGYYLPRVKNTIIHSESETLVKDYPDWERVPEGEIFHAQTVDQNSVTMPIAISTLGKDMTVSYHLKSLLDPKKDSLDADGNAIILQKVINLKHTCSGDLKLTFSGDNCTAAPLSSNGTWSYEEWNTEKEVIEIHTETVPMTIVSANGTYTEQSDHYMWGNKKRNGLSLNLDMTFGDIKCKSELDMALQRRGQGNTVQEFSVTLKK